MFARKHHTEMARADVKTIVDRTVAVVRHKLQMQAIELSADVPELPPVFCDASQIQQVLVAIVMNAAGAKATPDELVDQSVRVLPETQ